MEPKIHQSTYIDPNAVIIGNVKIGKKCGIYPNTVIRGDQNLIEIKNQSNIQDNCTIHTDEKNQVIINEKVSIGHGAIIHGAIIEEKCIIGMNATVLNGAKIKKGTIIGANAVVTENTEIPENSLVVGVPGKIIRTDEKLRKMAEKNAEKYTKISQQHKEGKHQRI
ncbi:MAG: gamma carbonic anhydrase family protein [Candidatus Thermoplasmatota archaeon]